MTDTTTQQPLRVSSNGAAGAYIMVPVSQLEAIEQVLKANGIHFWVSENAISFNGAPETTIVNLGRVVDASVVQHILDSVN